MGFRFYSAIEESRWGVLKAAANRRIQISQMVYEFKLARSFEKFRYKNIEYCLVQIESGNVDTLSPFDGVYDGNLNHIFPVYFFHKEGSIVLKKFLWKDLKEYYSLQEYCEKFFVIERT